MARTIEEAKKLIESFGKLQEKNSSKYSYPCPRCGNDSMNEKLTRNALSRRADIYICDACGMEEALMDAAGKEPLPFNKWGLFLTIEVLSKDS